MPAELDYDGERLSLKIGGLDSEAFQHALNAARSITGRTWNPEGKTWDYPADFMTAQKIQARLNPILSPAAAAWLGQAKDEQADAVRTRLPDDSDALTLSWSDKLYPFQRASVEYMAEHPHIINGDDMGLGKTVQSIATVYEKSQREGRWFGPVLVVCPNAMCGTWHDEIVTWTNKEREATMAAPVPPPVILNAKNPQKRRQQVDAGRAAGWLIVNWEKLRIMPELAQVEWGTVIADEAHRAKNRKAKQTRALWKLQAPIQLALTGTPILNSPDELWPLLKWLYPKTYTSYWRFYEEYVEYVEAYFGQNKSRVVTGVKNVDALRFELSDKLIRRTKREVLPNLPEKLPPQYIYVNMHPRQQKLYDRVESELWVEVEQAAKEGDTHAQAAVEQGNMLLLPNAAARTTRLRQVSSSPALLGSDDYSAKLDAVVEYITDAGPDRKVVVYCEFTDTCELLVGRLAKRHIDAAAYHGKVASSVREDLKHAFQHEASPRVLVCTPETGGVGLTLTRANIALFESEDWVPGLNRQGEDRLHRIGQEREVHVVVFRNANSVDVKRVARTLDRKARIEGAIIKQDREV